MSATLPRLKAIWRDQIFIDPELTPSAFKIGYAMADFITMRDTAARFRRRDEIVIFPSQQTLQQRTHLSADTVRAGIAQLIARRHLRQIRRGNQFTGANNYKVIIGD